MSKKRKGRQHKEKVQRKPKPQPPAATTLVDICMPVFGEWNMAKLAIDAIPAAMAPLTEDQYRVIVLDNGTPVWNSPEGVAVQPKEMSGAVQGSLRPQDLFMRSDKNMGYPGGCNHAIARGRSPLVIVLTADVIMLPGGLNALVRALDDPGIGVAGSKLLFPEADMMESPHGKPGSVQHAGIIFDIGGNTKHIFMEWSRDHPKVNQRRVMAAVTGAVFVTRRTLWNQVGPFSELYGGGTYEDVDYCFSVQRAGLKVLYEPASEGYHLVSGARIHGANPQGFALARNQQTFRSRWGDVLGWDGWKYW